MPPRKKSADSSSVLAEPVPSDLWFVGEDKRYRLHRFVDADGRLVGVLTPKNGEAPTWTLPGNPSEQFWWSVCARLTETEQGGRKFRIVRAMRAHHATRDSTLPALQRDCPLPNDDALLLLGMFAHDLGAPRILQVALADYAFSHFASQAEGVDWLDSEDDTQTPDLMTGQVKSLRPPSRWNVLPGYDRTWSEDTGDSLVETDTGRVYPIDDTAVTLHELAALIGVMCIAYPATQSMMPLQHLRLLHQLRFAPVDFDQEAVTKVWNVVAFAKDTEGCDITHRTSGLAGPPAFWRAFAVTASLGLPKDEPEAEWRANDMLVQAVTEAAEALSLLHARHPLLHGV